MIYYLSGLKFGFRQSLYPFSFKIILEYILPYTVIIVCSEIIRYIFLAQNNKQADIISFVSCVLVDFLMTYNLFSINNLNSFMDAVGLTLFPSITANVLFHYLSKNYGFVPNMIFRLATTLYIYIISFVPSTPDSLVALFKLLIPLLIYSFIKMLYQKKQNVVLYRQSKCSNIIFITTVILMISLMMLCSNQFKFGVIVIATDSMKEEISSGDVVIYERIDSDDVLEINQIIVFEKDNSLIIHRIVNMEFIDGELRYYTKGDNNEENDSGYITRNNIIGYTDFKISYVGYPTLWLHEIFK